MQTQEMDVTSLRQELAANEQQHLLTFWDDLTDDEKGHLYRDLKSIDLSKVCKVMKQSLSPSCDAVFDDQSLEPLPDDVHESVSRSDPQTLLSYRQEGLRQIAEGRVAALLLAGGQGTRLGVSHPKGMFDVGLPSNKTLYQLQGERLRRLCHLAQELTGKSSAIPWYIMTSEQTKEPTRAFFRDRAYFGLQESDVFIFEQQTLPCFTPDGKIILETSHSVARAPDGNGGLYDALRDCHVLEDMRRRGVQYVHVYGVDNILVKIADPTFVGYCVKKGAEAGAKVVEKAHPSEAVGIICKVRGEFQVVEYSEITPAIAEARNGNGRLTFNAGSICNHFFTVDFLHHVSHEKELKHHVARKKIPFIDSVGKQIRPESPNGIKLEKFVFDVFPFTQKFVVWEVRREEEFSPLKNAETAAKDTPATARSDLFALHRSYIERAGGLIDGRPVANACNGSDRPPCDITCEISPLVTYDGEGLQAIVKGRMMTPPILICSDQEHSHSHHKVANGTLVCGDVRT